MGNGPVEWCQRPIIDSKNEILNLSGGIYSIMAMRKPGQEYLRFTRIVSHVNLLSELDNEIMQISGKKKGGSNNNNKVLKLIGDW